MAGELDVDGPAAAAETPTGLRLDTPVERAERGFGDVAGGPPGGIIDYVPAASLRRRRPLWMLLGMVVGIGVSAGAVLVLTLQQPAVRERLPLPDGQSAPVPGQPVPTAAANATDRPTAPPATAAPSAAPLAPAASPKPEPSASATPAPGPSATPAPGPTPVPVTASPIAGGVYRIVNQVGGKPFGVAGASTANGAQIVSSAYDGALDQVWALVDAGGGYFNIINGNSGLALDDTNGSRSNGTVMQQWAISGTGNSNQQWRITSVGGGCYLITNRTSGLVLDLTNGNTTDGTPIQQWSGSAGNPNQRWQFILVK